MKRNAVGTQLLTCEAVSTEISLSLVIFGQNLKLHFTCTLPGVKIIWYPDPLLFTSIQRTLLMKPY